MKKCDYAVTA